MMLWWWRAFLFSELFGFIRIMIEKSLISLIFNSLSASLINLSDKPPQKQLSRRSKEKLCIPLLELFTEEESRVESAGRSKS